MIKEALVVRTDILFKEKSFEGFLPIKSFDYFSVILNNFEFSPRGEELENNLHLQQIIPYVWIINSKDKKIFTYKRSAGTNYNETRLRNKWSCGVGGHIEREDAANPIELAMMRELQEEVKIGKDERPQIIGFVKDNSDSVGKVHFGVVGLIDTVGEVSKADDEMQYGSFLTIEEFENLISQPENDLEGWSKLCWPFIKNYLI